MALSLSSLLAHGSRFTRLPLLSLRYYNLPQHNKTTDEYRDFRKTYTAMRAQLLDNSKQAKKMMEEDQNSQAAKDAREEMEREAKAIAENEKELEKMAKER